MGSHDFLQFLKLACDGTVIVSVMGKIAIAAVFDPVFQKLWVSSTLLSKHVERAIAEQTVEVFDRNPLMAREIFAVLMRKEGKSLAFHGFS